MNTRSLKFQLIVWYAGLLAACFVLLGAITYLVLQNSLTGALKESQWRRARQIGQLLREEIAQTLSDASQVEEELRSLQAALAG